MAEENVKDSIEKNAKGPRRAKGDVGEVQQHTLKDQVAADRYLASKETDDRATKSLRFAKLSPPGASQYLGS